ncbi:MAG TPA: hypothetical protein ACHBX0_10925 [Arsenophonus sp.]
MGFIYDARKYIEKNNYQAFYWYKRAAEQGYVNAQYHLAEFYEHGYGVEQNAILGRQW